MQFHPQKGNVIHVTNKRKPITHSYKLHDHILEVMENSKYLGVTINGCCIFIISDMSVQQTIVCEESNIRCSVFWQVVYEG
jgi:hypothetical protein